MYPSRSPPPLGWRRNVYLLRGNHESTTCTMFYGFKAELQAKYLKQFKVGARAPPHSPLTPSACPVHILFPLGWSSLPPRIRALITPEPPNRHCMHTPPPSPGGVPGL